MNARHCPRNVSSIAGKTIAAASNPQRKTWARTAPRQEWREATEPRVLQNRGCRRVPKLPLLAQTSRQALAGLRSCYNCLLSARAASLQGDISRRQLACQLRQVR